MSEQDRIRLEILTTYGPVLDTLVEGFTAPGVMGSTGVLYNHAPLVSLLEPGVLTYTREGRSVSLAVGRGFMEVLDNQALVLVDFAEGPEQIDYQRAVLAETHAREDIKAAQAAHDPQALALAQRSLLRAKARQKVARPSENNQ